MNQPEHNKTSSHDRETLPQLHVCDSCQEHDVYPVEWEESGPTHWSVLSRCGNCDDWKEGEYSQAAVDAWDTHLDRDLDKMAGRLRSIEQHHMTKWVENFAGALAVEGGIEPDDFNI
jgi:hypothetical protein